MNKKKSKNYVFENDLLMYESHIHGFSDKVIAEYDDKSEEKNLRSKIEDLMNAKVVNHSENQAAFHPQYRKKDNRFGGRDGLSPSSLGQLNSKLMAKGIREANVIVLAIGGSYEGPKLLLESINQPDFNCLDSKVN